MPACPSLVVVVGEGRANPLTSARGRASLAAHLKAYDVEVLLVDPSGLVGEVDGEEVGLGVAVVSGGVSLAQDPGRVGPVMGPPANPGELARASAQRR